MKKIAFGFICGGLCSAGVVICLMLIQKGGYYTDTPLIASGAVTFTLALTTVYSIIAGIVEIVQQRRRMKRQMHR